ncbi:unnamed protein product [Amoebophrya sp. A120]|nr:unnamed protein product [Amoebophrya sp. A120]|eukprot:GSA120T00005874001.1
MDTKLFIDLLANRSESKFEQLPEKITEYMPKKEPTYDKDLGIIFRVLEPYYTKAAVDDVTTAMLNGEISSGTRWPRQMAEKICATYSVPVAFPTSSGASALHVSLLCINVYQYEVIVPALTMVAVANAVKLAGGIPIFADCAKDNINPSLKEIKAKKSVRTKAVIVCHTYGIVCPEIREIAEYCKQENLPLIEDICECMGARVDNHPEPRDPTVGRYLLAGAFGDFSCSSLYANKQITAGDGGWVHSISEEHAPRLKSLINHGFDPAFHFLHFETAPNAKINGLGAAFLNSQIGENLHQQVEKRHEIAFWYRKALWNEKLTAFNPEGTETERTAALATATSSSSGEDEEDPTTATQTGEDHMGESNSSLAAPPAQEQGAQQDDTNFLTPKSEATSKLENSQSGRLPPLFPLRGINEKTIMQNRCFFDAPWVFGIETKDQKTRDSLRQYLAEFGIESRNYFFPLHVQPVNYYEYARGVAGSYKAWEVELPHALKFGSVGLYLPTHSFLEEEDVTYIVAVCKRFFFPPEEAARNQHSTSEEDKLFKELSTARKKGWVDEKRSVLLGTKGSR